MCEKSLYEIGCDVELGTDGVGMSVQTSRDPGVVFVAGSHLPNPYDKAYVLAGSESASSVMHNSLSMFLVAASVLFPIGAGLYVRKKYGKKNGTLYGLGAAAAAIPVSFYANKFGQNLLAGRPVNT